MKAADTSNSDVASGDGCKYRGRGMMQHTGRSGYRAFTVAHNAKNAADSDNLNAVTTAVNGGLNGLADRKARLDAVKKLLAL